MSFGKKMIRMVLAQNNLSFLVFGQVQIPRLWNDTVMNMSKVPG